MIPMLQRMKLMLDAMRRQRLRQSDRLIHTNHRIVHAMQHKHRRIPSVHVPNR